MNRWMATGAAAAVAVTLTGCLYLPPGEQPLPIEERTVGEECVNGEALLDEPGASYTIEGECGRVVIEGSGIRVDAETIGQLEIYGNENVVDAGGSIGVVVFDGDDNFVTTLLSVGDVTDDGQRNLITTPQG